MRLLKIDGAEPDPGVIDEAVDVLLDGGLVVYPTDTLYGLGCDATNAEAVRRLREVKGRDPSEPLPIIVNGREMMRRLVADLTSEVDALLSRFWPGALTVVLPRRGAVLGAVAPRGTLGIRIPDSPVALTLARRLARPIVSTSANVHAEPPLRDPATVASSFAERIDLILDAGALDQTQASTVLDLSGASPLILREGAITREKLARYLPGLTG